MSEVGQVLTTYVEDVQEAQTWHGQHTAVLQGELDNHIETNQFWPGIEKVALDAPNVYALSLFAEEGSENRKYMMNGNRAHIVTENYPVMQHQQMLQVPEDVRDLVQDGTAGYFGNGEIAWRQWLLESFEPVKGDEVKLQFMLTNSHNGRISFLGGLCSERVVCRNTHMVALSEINNSSGRVSLKKTKNANTRYEESVKAAMSKIIEQAAGFKDFAEALVAKPTTDELFETLLRVAFPSKKNSDGTEKVTTRLENQWDQLRELRAGGEFGAMGSDITGVSSSLWGDLNVFTEFSTHWQPTRVTGSSTMDDNVVEIRQQEQRVQRAWFGQSRDMLDRVSSKLYQLVA